MFIRQISSLRNQSDFGFVDAEKYVGGEGADQDVSIKATNTVNLQLASCQSFADQKLLPIRVFPLWIGLVNQMIVEENEAEIVAAAIHFPGVIGVLHERLEILVADRDGREHVARLTRRNQNLQKNPSRRMKNDEICSLRV